MDSIAIKSSRDDCTLEFFDRLPEDRSSPIDSFHLRITRFDLFAAAKVYAGYTHSHPAHWFGELARDWQGWDGQREWESLEGEMKLVATNDRRGHIGIKTVLRSGHYDNDWLVSAVTFVDAGQLDGIGAHAVSFFGEWVTYHEK